jgi:hypothetical protein
MFGQARPHLVPQGRFGSQQVGVAAGVGVVAGHKSR